MKNEKLKQEYLSLLEKNTKEEIYQSFLEKNTILIPTKPFELNHCVHFSLVFKKFKIGTSYISDFFYMTKSTAEWNFVFIELEKPNAKLFNKDGNISYELNTGISQIQNWQTYFSSIENRLAFKQNTIIKELISFNPSFFHKPINFKYILVIGRRNELENSVHKEKFRSLFPQDSYIMTYDSLCESLSQKQEHYICRIVDNKLCIDTDKLIEDNIFHWLKCNNIRIRETLYNELKTKYSKFDETSLLEKYTKLSPQKLNFLKENIII